MLFFFLFFCLLSTAVAHLQGVAVRGRLLCGKKPLVATTVKIVDRDYGDPDDLLDETRTDSDGRFVLSGATREESPMQAAIKIYHDCNDEKKRKILWEIPRSYNHNGTVLEWFDIGEVNMQLNFRNEERDCRHKRRHAHRRL